MAINISAESTLAAGSAIKQGFTSRLFQKRASNPEAGAVQKRTMFPANGFTPPPIVAEASKITADFYRRGKISPTIVGEFAIRPKQIYPWDINETEASIRVFGKGKDGSIDKDLIPPYTKFILENVQESHEERTQIVETFGDFYVFFFGERPPVYNFSGTLINTKNANWVSDFMFTYTNFLRGTKCVELRAQVVLSYAGRQVQGFMLRTSSSTQAVVEGGVPFNFSVIVTSRKFLGFSADFGFAQTTVGEDAGQLLLDTTVAGLLNTIAGKEGTGTSNSGISGAIDDAKSIMGGGSAGFPQGVTDIIG